MATCPAAVAPLVDALLGVSEALGENLTGVYEVLELLDRAEVPTLLVATKIDKLKRSERKRNLERIRESLALSEEALIVPFSVVTGEGKKELWSVIEDLLSEKAGQK